MAKKVSFDFITQELREEYKETTGITITDSFLNAMFNEIRANDSLSALVGAPVSDISVQKRMIEALHKTIEYWPKSAFLNALSKSGGVNIDGDFVRINPTLIAEYQHRVGVILSLDRERIIELKRFIKLGMARAGKDENENTSPEEKTRYIEEYYLTELEKYREDETFGV